jgi:hypothetical protein
MTITVTPRTIRPPLLRLVYRLLNPVNPPLSLSLAPSFFAFSLCDLRVSAVELAFVN